MLRQKLVGSAVGDFAMGARDSLRILKLAHNRDPELADELNNQLAARFLSSLVQPQKTFVDIGAHIGSVIADVLRHAPGVKIIAFEAIPDKVAKLRTKFPNITIHECALSDREGVAPFFIDTAQSGYSSLQQSSSNMVEITVPLRRLDDLVPDSDIDVMKIDVEGAELDVLKGGTRLLDRCRPTIMFESGPTDNFATTKHAMWGWLDGADYAIFAPDRLAHTAPPMSADVFVDSHEYPRRTTNYFAVHRSRVPEIHARAAKIMRVG